MEDKKVALILGGTGQDASYLAEHLIAKGYNVHVTVRRSSTINTSRIDHIFPPEERTNVHYGELNDSSIVNLIHKLKPDMIFMLAAMSHVRVSFDIPIYTAKTNFVATTRILEGVRKGIKSKILDPKIKLYFAASSEMFGLTPPPQNEATKMLPCSPYGIAKLASYLMVKHYRRSYGIFAVNGILFNHCSKRRGKRFVTRKITRAACRIKLGLQDKLELGNLSSTRDWGHSADYCQAMIMMMDYHTPDDWVVSMNETHSIEHFLHKVFEKLGLDVDKYVKYNKDLIRPTDVPALLGDSTKIRTILGWKPEYTFDMIVDEMIEEDMRLATQEKLILQNS